MKQFHSEAKRTTDLIRNRDGSAGRQTSIPNDVQEFRLSILDQHAAGVAMNECVTILLDFSTDRMEQPTGAKRQRASGLIMFEKPTNKANRRKEA